MTESYSSLYLRRLFNTVVKIMGFGADYLRSNSASPIYELCHLGKFS